MSEISLDTMMRSWVDELGVRGPLPFPPPTYYAMVGREYNEENRRQTLIAMGREAAEIDELIVREKRQFRIDNPRFVVRTTTENALTARQEGRRTTIELGRFLGGTAAKGFVLLNGDGFDNNTLQVLQTNLRQNVTNRFPRTAQRMIVPYAALSSAGINLATIHPVHIGADKRVNNVVEVPRVPDKILLPHTKVSRDKNRSQFDWNGRTYRTTWWYAQNYRLDIFHRAEFAPRETWHPIRAEVRSEFPVGQVPPSNKWEVTENVHRLGASVFWAEDTNGNRARWLSAFDQNEDPPMYFLAQLPQKGGIRYVTHAVRLLAPPIVEKARQDGRRVFRQGDIFAIETDLTDKDFAGHRVAYRNNVFNTNGTLTEYGRNKLRLRRSLMIYGTGHTATQVIQTDRGTFVRGAMYHDPILENIRGNRAPEHRELPLGDGSKWYLCCRNTVPRLNTTNQGGTDNAVQHGNLPDVRRNLSRQARQLPQPELRRSAAGRNR